MTENCWTPDFSLVHMGINADDMDKAKEIADAYASLFAFNTRGTPTSVFSGEIIEVMGGGGRGTHGHIAIGTHDMDSAIAWLRAKGVEFIAETMVKNAEGKYGAVYLKEEIGGFAIHLIPV